MKTDREINMYIKAALDRFDERERAAAWARWMLAEPTVVINIDGNGRDIYNEAVKIAVMAIDGRPLLDTLVRPEFPISEDATEVHGITNEMVAKAPTFRQVAPRLARLVCGRPVVAYDAAYHRDTLEYCWSQCFRHGQYPQGIFQVGCAMLAYAPFRCTGDLCRRFETHSPLDSCRGAYGACFEVIALLKHMAADRYSA